MRNVVIWQEVDVLLLHMHNNESHQMAYLNKDIKISAICDNNFWEKSDRKLLQTDTKGKTVYTPLLCSGDIITYNHRIL